MNAYLIYKQSKPIAKVIEEKNAFNPNYALDSLRNSQMCSENWITESRGLIIMKLFW